MKELKRTNLSTTQLAHCRDIERQKFFFRENNDKRFLEFPSKFRTFQKQNFIFSDKILYLCQSFVNFDFVKCSSMKKEGKEIKMNLAQTVLVITHAFHRKFL
jgi:hypothetical protein